MGYKKVLILTQSKTECLFYPGRVVEVYFNSRGEASGGITYSYCGGMADIYTPMKPDFEYKILK